MHRGLKLRDQVFACTIATYMDTQSRSINAFTLFVHCADDCKDITEGDWPSEEDFTVGSITRTNTGEHRNSLCSSSSSGLSVCPHHISTTHTFLIPTHTFPPRTTQFFDPPVQARPVMCPGLLDPFHRHLPSNERVPRLHPGEMARVPLQS